MSPDTTDQSADDSASPYIQSLGWAGDVRRATRARPVGGVVILLTFVPFWNLGGISGGLAWLALAGSWLLFPPIVPVVFGQFILIALLPAGTTLTSVFPVQAALLALLAASFLDSGAWILDHHAELVSTRQNIADALGYLGVAIALSASITYAVQAVGPLFAGGLCVCIITIVAFILRPAFPK